MPIITFKAKAKSENPMKSVIETSRFRMIIDEPVSMGGTDAGAAPVEYLLAALAGCLNIVGHAVAQELGMKLNGLEINVEGDLNPAKFMGQSADQRTGYQDVRVSLKPDTDADQATLDKWLASLEERCPVSDNLVHETPLKLSLYWYVSWGVLTGGAFYAIRHDVKSYGVRIRDDWIGYIAHFIR